MLGVGHSTFCLLAAAFRQWGGGNGVWISTTSVLLVKFSTKKDIAQKLGECKGEKNVKTSEFCKIVLAGLNFGDKSESKSLQLLQQGINQRRF